jgi:hypothetical protein
MRAMVFDRYGEPEVMHLKDVPGSRDHLGLAGREGVGQLC